MKVDIISNNNSNPGFKALKIFRQDIYPWNADVLENFVNNKEVQKLVSLFHAKGKNIVANYREYKAKPIEVFIKLDILDKDKNYETFIGTSFCEIKYDDLNRFNAQNAISAYEEREKDTLLSQEKMKKALDFVEKFNASLDKKWYQFWK